MHTNCKHCGETLEKDWDQCPSCLNPVADRSKCGNCGRDLKPQWKMCPSCKTPTPHSVTQDGSSQQTPSPGNYNPFVSNIKSPGQSPGTPSPSPGATPVQQQTPIGQVPDIPEGEVLKDGEFRIKQKLGTGGCGTVYRAEHTTLGEDRALKVIGGFDIAEEMLKVFVSEYKAQLQIKDRSHILWSESPLRCTHGGMQWILLPMELGEKTLRDWLRETKNDIEGRLQQGLEYFKQACRGVEALHKEGLLHLDIKPENILLVREQGSDKLTAKIGDFGLTRGLGKALENRPDLLADGVGTPAYMAPEQILAARWKDVGKEADIYGLGMILYELIDGDLPYSGTAQQIREKKIDPRVVITPLTTHPEISKVAMGCLELDKKKRIGSVREILVQIDEQVKKEEEMKKNKEKAKELLTDAKDLIRSKDYDEALLKLREAEGLDGNNKEIQKLRGEVGKEIERIERERKAKEEEERKEAERREKAEKERKKREKLKELIGEAEELIDEESYEDALEILEEAEELDADNSDVKDLKEKAKSEIRRKERERKRRESEYVVDIDGNRYKTVKIGNQLWIAENLNVSRFRNGDIIPEVRDNKEWERAGDNGRPAWCYYDNDPSNGRVYGKLYNWYAVTDPRGLAPEGWHVPGDEEWEELCDYLGGERVAGGKMKERGTTHWESPNEGATNESGFSGLPGGYRSSVGYFYDREVYAYFWSDTEYNSVNAWYRNLYYSDSALSRGYSNKHCGFSVRILRD